MVASRVLTRGGTPLIFNLCSLRYRQVSLWLERQSSSIKKWEDFVSAYKKTFIHTESLPIKWKKIWLERQSSSIKKWEDFVSAYKKTFIHTESLPIKWKKMAGRVQQRHESTSAYFHEKVKYCWDVGLTLEDTQDQIVIGMWNREVCSVITAIKHSNLHDLLHEMIKQESLIAERQERIKESIERKGKHKLEARQGKKEENCNYTPNADRDKPENKTEKHPYTRLPPRNEEGPYNIADRIISICILRPDRNNEVQIPNNSTLTDIKIDREETIIRAEKCDENSHEDGTIMEVLDVEVRENCADRTKKILTSCDIGTELNISQRKDLEALATSKWTSSFPEDDKQLRPLRFAVVMAFMDDLLIPSESIEEGLQNLEKVLKVLQKARLTLKPNKCSLICTQIKYLGFNIEAGGIQSGSRKDKCIRDFREPESIYQVRQFLGMTSYFRRFIRDHSLTAKPLTNLLRKNGMWTRGQKEQEAFDTLKRKLCENPVLMFYSQYAPIEVHTDACKNGLGGVLLQSNQNGQCRPVSVLAGRQPRKKPDTALRRLWRWCRHVKDFTRN
ncbi:RNase H-like domain found in reverse transcriptase [Popillia japonica]|uniref:RNA-directed DNA polymerase n=1 Tax=Popillia japonica TaxID=7064 RepID=A0AAW1JFB0_POPJA